MRLASTTAALACLALAGCGNAEVTPEQQPSSTTAAAAPTTPSSPAAAATQFAVSSPAFGDNRQIPAEYSCHGKNAPPPLRWENTPTDAASLALVVDDPDAPGGPYVHWVVTGIAPTVSEISDGALPDGATVGLNSAGKAQYFGPCPPAGTGVHHYRFQLYSMNTPSPLEASTQAPDAARQIAETAAAVAGTVGLFGE